MSYFMESERLQLRTLQKADLPQLAELMSDREIGMLSGEVHPLTEQGLDEMYEGCQKTDERIWFVIVEKATGKIIGETGFLRIFMPWRCADYSLMIWDRAYWGQGYGKEAAGLMLRYGFDTLNFHRLAIGVLGLNERALKFWRNLGFKEEGRQEDGFFGGGRYSDFIMLRLLEDEFRQQNPA